MATTGPNPNNLTSRGELASVGNPKPLNPFVFVAKSFEENYPPRFLKKVVAEVIATYLLVFVTCGTAAISADDESRVPKLGASVAGGLVVTVMIYAVGHISGAHMNPAVTTAFAVIKLFPWKQVPLYAVAQLTGAITASFTLKKLLHPIKHLGTTAPSGTDFQALLTEIVVTFSMMFVTSAVATDNKAVGELAGIAVGSAVCITSILAGPISGGSMNPARTLGPAVASEYYKGLWVYFIGPLTGTVLGAFSYTFIRERDKPDHPTSPSSVPLKVRRQRAQEEQLSTKDSLNVV
ncbi:hypothetical protein K2173_013941 [Erythroxylum novogranatense]|uniref:Uncharacterized protein n=1 Tax=Erythroxylum novogranatense TaxID=1862640 RepID=A0AAV8SCS7_9ROSI|nr:hypothetical protein K2173_013941 [Erythroxylum novogranatense]